MSQGKLILCSKKKKKKKKGENKINQDEIKAQ
jgi:hypothetical protein